MIVVIAGSRARARYSDPKVTKKIPLLQQRDAVCGFFTHAAALAHYAQERPLMGMLRDCQSS